MKHYVFMCDQPSIVGLEGPSCVLCDQPSIVGLDGAFCVYV